MICEHLESNKELIEGLDTKDILEIDRPNYVESMNSDNTWGGAIEIKSACDIWSLRIIVHHINFQKKYEKPLFKIEFLPTNGKRYRKTINLYYNGYHYEPIFVKDKVKYKKIRLS
jgi:hypothetical protein